LLGNIEEGVQEVHEELRRARITQITLALLAILASCFLAKLVLVTIFTSILMAFILEPVVRVQEKIRIPRPISSLIAVLLALGILYGLSHFFYQRARGFLHQLPNMSGEIRKVWANIRKMRNRLGRALETYFPRLSGENNHVPLKVQQIGRFQAILGPELSSIGEVALIVAFIPFLAYFVLTWQERARRATVYLFSRHSRLKAYHTLGKISDMMRAFIVGYFVIGIFMSVTSLVVFALLHLPYSYFLGFISGFRSLIPYLGVILAVLPLLASGIGVLHSTGIVIIAAVSLGLHLFSMNVLYPKVIGGRLELNPAVTLGLLVWGWIWGAMGLILAVPVLGTIKVVCHNIEGLEPFGDWLGIEIGNQKVGANRITTAH